MNTVKIDFDRCKQCLYCVKFCPKRILAVGEKINRHGYYAVEPTDMAACTACATCARVCPDGAVAVMKG